jgi:hypothetical protein
MNKETDTPEPAFIYDEAEIPDDVSQQMDDIVDKATEEPTSFELGDITSDEELEEKLEEKTEETDETQEKETEEEADKGEEETPEAEAKEGEEYEDIEPRLIRAARKRGWSDDKIIAMAQEAPEVLEEIATLVEGIEAASLPKRESTQPEEREEPKKKLLPTSELDGEALKKLSDEYGEDVVSKVIAPLNERLNSTITAINEMRGTMDESREVVDAKSQMERLQVANDVFDKAAKTFPELGTTEKLPRALDGRFNTRSPEIQLRTEICEVALTFEKTGIPFDKAMQEALTWYKGKKGDKSIQRKVVKDINKQKKKFLARPTQKKYKKTYASKDDEAKGTMDEIYADMGIEVN